MRYIPNILSLIRAAAVPFFIYFILADRFTVGLIIVVAAGLTDLLDGQIARRYHIDSKLGIHLDAGADMLLGISAYVTLCLKGLIPAWLGALVFTRYIATSLGALILLALDMQAIVKPSYLGKATCVFQIFTVILALLGTFAILRPYLYDTGFLKYFFLFAGLMPVLSGTDYVARYLRDYEKGLFVKVDRG